MFAHPKTLTMAAVAALTVGLSAVLVTAAPASATPFSCGLGATDLGGGVCELTYTAGSATFTPVPGTVTLEALLVGGGGAGNYVWDEDDSGVGGAGGGGEVKVVNFSDTSTPIDLTVGDPGSPSSVIQGLTTSFTAEPGDDGTSDGASGNGNLGVSGGPGGGAGASPSPANAQDGGAGQVVSALAGSSPLFATDSNCYGGGGAIEDSSYDYGIATCGGGYEQDQQPPGATTDDPAAVAPVANSGGGGSLSLISYDYNAGAAGLVVIRWVAATPVTVNFVLNGHGSPIPDQIVASGTEAVQPSDPSATGFIFNGWYSDAGLTTKANFSTSILVNTTFSASWSSVPAVAAPLTVNFVLNGHGSSIPDQSVASGAEATQPTDPSAAGFTFNGWYSNPALTAKADFTAPILVNTTFYASWGTPSALALTGVGVEPWAIPGAVGALLVGLVVVVVSRRRRGFPVS